MPGVSRGRGRAALNHPTPNEFGAAAPRAPSPVPAGIPSSAGGGGGPSECWGQRERPTEALRTLTRLSQGGGPPTHQHEVERGGGRVCVPVPRAASAAEEHGCPADGAHAEGQYRQPRHPPPAALRILPGRSDPEERPRCCRGIPRRCSRRPTETAGLPAVLRAPEGGPTRTPPHPPAGSALLPEELFPEHAALGCREPQEGIGSGPEPGCLQAHGQEFEVSHQFSGTPQGQSEASVRRTRNIASSALYPPLCSPPPAAIGAAAPAAPRSSRRCPRWPAGRRATFAGPQPRAGTRSDTDPPSSIPPPSRRGAASWEQSRAEQDGVFRLGPTWLSLQSSPGGTAARAAAPAGGGSPGIAPHSPSAQRGHPKTPSRCSPPQPGCSWGGSGSGRPVAAWLLRGRLLAKAQPGNGEGAAESPASSRQRAVPGHRGRGEPCPKGRDIWGGGEGFATLLGGLGLQLWEGGGSHPYLAWNAAGVIAVPCPFGDAPFGVAAFEVAAPLGKA